ncbi:MAG TPA: DUF5686 family protein [Flavobacterium sp.]|nr:DUF5686 family protein [Flavobacterium sp.]
MRKKLLFILFFVTSLMVAQTKVSGIVYDDNNQPMPFASVAFKGTTLGMVTNENGKFYLESNANNLILVVSFVGYKSQERNLSVGGSYNLKFTLEPDNLIEAIQIVGGKQSKKNNPAIDILRKIWERKRKNGLYMFDQYKMDKYEKIQFDLNNVDSTYTQSKVFKGMEFIFEQVDTSKITGKTYLPFFISESTSEIYGDNVLDKKKEIMTAYRNSGFDGNENVMAFVKNLYKEYNIYDNFINLFDKSFHSPISRYGIDTYNYVLTDSAYIDNKWCYNIIYYPRRKGELTFKGDFWVNDSTFAIKKISMAVTKSANINWIKDVYIEQEFDVLNDSVFLLSRDYFMSDFALNKKDESKGVYGKRTSIYQNHIFNQEQPSNFYREKVNTYDESIYLKDDNYWVDNRMESLSRDERGVYQMLDTLQNVKRFRQMYNLISIIGSGYIRQGNFEYGPILSTFGYNEVEGLRLRTGGRTYFNRNDQWRIEGYTAYGFKDDQIKYGISGKWLFGKKNRMIISAGNRRDIEQIGANLTATNDVLGRDFASSAIFSSGDTSKLTSVNLTTTALEIEPLKNLKFKVGFNYRTLETASPTFSLDYYDNLGNVRSKTTQSEANFVIDYSPNKKNVGYGVERRVVDKLNYGQVFATYSKGIKGVLNSDFEYDKIQLYYKQPITIGLIGKTYVTTEIGKTFGDVPLGLLSVIPGNQSYFSIPRNFDLVNYYEFITDRYATLNVDHHFNGKIFSRIPWFRDLNWRETAGFKLAIGDISETNKALNASGISYRAPTKPYWEYNVGIENILKVMRVEFTWRGSYRDAPDTSNFGVKVGFGIFF